jgi:hypothetical protein
MSAFAMTTDMTKPRWTLRRLFEAVLRLMTRTDTTGMEFVSSATLFVFGAILAMPGEQLSPWVPLFVGMKRMMPEEMWAALFLCVSLVQTFGNLYERAAWRSLGAFWAAAWFLALFALGMRSRPISILGGVLGVQGFVQSIVYLKFRFSPIARGNGAS